MFLTDIAESISDFVAAVIIIKVLIWIIIIAAVGVIMFFVIRAICNYQARRNAEEFDYEYLAERMAEELCKRMALIEKSKASNNNTNASAGEQQSDERASISEDR